jgi:uncharacterized membrane protein YgcG
VSTVTRQSASKMCANDAQSNTRLLVYLYYIDAQDEDEAVYEETGAYQSSETEPSNHNVTSGENPPQKNPDSNNHPPPKTDSTGVSTGGGSGGGSGGSGGESSGGGSGGSSVSVH